jgi:hypothetical protein
MLRQGRPVVEGEDQAGIDDPRTLIGQGQGMPAESAGGLEGVNEPQRRLGMP